jgi:signal transduction histidine kinase
MQEVTSDPRTMEIERLIRALQEHLEAGGASGAAPEVLRLLNEQLEKQAEGERRIAELFASEQLARTEAREQRDANAAKDRFLAMLSHELRMPLQPVLGAASALLRDPRIPPDLLDDIRTIQRNVQLEARLIDDLLELTRAKHGKLSIEPTKVNMHSVISRAVDICEPDVIAKHMTFSTRLEAKRTWVHADPGRMQQVMWNLIKNAVKFTPPRGTITVETSDGKDGGRLVVRVCDNGIGIEPESLPRIFDAFEQADENVARRFGGLGLGLAISKMLVDRHGGTLAAHSDGKMRGSTFTMALPTVDGPVATPQAEGGVRGTYAPAKRTLQILLVEDDEPTAEIMTKLLRSLGHHVQVAGDCANATARAGDGDFDLLICDIALPDGSGLDLIAKFRWHSVKSIALTGYGSEEDVRASLDAGFDVHITKPVTFGRLVEAIDKLFP